VRSTYSSDYIAKVLRRNGFRLVHQRGSHAKYRKDSRPARTVILPMGRKDMRRGTFHSILEQAGLTEDAFRKDRAA
jgi:predicted RNA binding protein YcfA (HicA-like mRNA interferase family)